MFNTPVKGIQTVIDRTGTGVNTNITCRYPYISQDNTLNVRLVIMYKAYIKECSIPKDSSMVKHLSGVDSNANRLEGGTEASMSGPICAADSEEDRERLDQVSNSINTPGPWPNNRKLVLHFDVRNTVLVADSISNVSVEQALNSFLTGVTWGREGPQGEWVWHSDQLSLTPPAPDTITYYKYLEKQFVKDTNDRTRLRLATGDFTQSEIGDIFHTHFQNHLELLKWRHEYDSQQHECLTMAGKDGQRYNYLVPALYKCINHLLQSKRDFAIVFRTYGLDAPNVIKSLEHGLRGNHPGFPSVVNMQVTETIGTVRRADKQPIVFKVFSDDTEEPEVFTGDRQIYEMLSQKTGISGFREDVDVWLENSYSHVSAKPLIIDPYDKKVHHIFFDDNIRTYEDDSIVDVRLFEARGAKRARSLSKTEAAQFDNICMVQADLINIIDNEDYYIQRVAECENNYTAFLKNYGKFLRCVSHDNNLHV